MRAAEKAALELLSGDKPGEDRQAAQARAGRELAAYDAKVREGGALVPDEPPVAFVHDPNRGLDANGRVAVSVPVDARESLGVSRICRVAADHQAHTAGQLKLVLATKPDLELKEWVTRDAQGVDTRVERGPGAHQTLIWAQHALGIWLLDRHQHYPKHQGSGTRIEAARKDAGLP